MGPMGKTLNPRPETLNLKPWTLNPKLSQVLMAPSGSGTGSGVPPGLRVEALGLQGLGFRVYRNCIGFGSGVLSDSFERKF